MLHCTETVTFLRLLSGTNGDTYAATEYQGVSWFDKTRIKTENAGMVFDNAVQIRIPAAVIGTGNLPREGDFIIHGKIPAGVTITRRADLEPYSPLKVMTVGDNRRGGLPHVAVIGQ